MASASTTIDPAAAFLDTSAVVALLEAAPVSAAVQRREMFASTLVLAECASLVERGRLPRAALVELLASLRLEGPSPEDLLDAGRLHGRLRMAGNRKASLSDCIMYQTARRLGLQLVTHDRDLAGQPGVVVL